jgi:hypothetical protein
MDEHSPQKGWGRPKMDERLPQKGWARPKMDECSPQKGWGRTKMDGRFPQKGWARPPSGPQRFRSIRVSTRSRVEENACLSLAL